MRTESVGKSWYLWLVLIVVWPGFVSAQFENCQEDETVEGCFDRLTVMKPAADMVSDRAALGTDGGNGGALVDLLAPFLGSLGFGDFDSDSGNITSKKTFYLGSQRQWKGSLGGTLLADAGIFSPLETKLKEALDDPTQADAISALESEIGRYQNLDVEFILSFEGRWLGRDWGRGADDHQNLTRMLVSRSELNLNTLRADPTDLNGFWGNEVDSVRKAKASGAERARARQAVDQFDEGVRFTKLAAQPMHRMAADLIANQPQLLLMANYRDRQDGVVGPSSVDASLKVEFGVSGNVNDLESWSQDSEDCSKKEFTSLRLPEETDQCIQAYMEKNSPDKGNRFSLKVTYADVDAFAFELPEQSFSYTAPETTKWTGALSFGRWLSGVSLGNPADREGNARMDLEASWEDPSDDEMRQERLVATLTLSQKMTACTTLSVGLVWANRPEFRGDVDEELSAQLGLRWDKKKLDNCKGNGS